MSDGSWGSPAPPPPPPGGGASRGAPSAPAPHPPRQAAGGERSSAAFRDTIVVAALAVIGVVGMFVWSGGDPPEAANLDVPTGSVPDDFGSIPGPFPPASGEFATPGVATLPDVTFGGFDTSDTVLPNAPDVTFGSENPDSPEASADMIALLPAPTGGAEQPAGFGGTRSWIVSNPDWRAVRDPWVAAISSYGYTVEVSVPITDASGQEFGETFTIFDAAMASVFATVQGNADGTTSVAVVP